MSQWIQDLTAGWPMIRANLPTFFAILALMGVAVWIISNWYHSGVLASKNGQIELLERQLSEYKSKLDGATPDQARDKIERLENIIKVTVGSQWIPLGKSEINNLASKLKNIGKSRVHVMYENALGKAMAQSIFDAFKQDGWDQAQISSGSGLGDGIVVGWSSRAVAVKEALELVANLPVWAKDTEKEIPDLLIVGVGINSR